MFAKKKKKKIDIHGLSGLQTKKNYAVSWNCNSERFLNIFIAPRVCTIEITKNKTKSHSVATQVSAEMAVLFMMGRYPKTQTFFHLFFFPQILLQHCIFK